MASTLLAVTMIVIFSVVRVVHPQLATRKLKFIEIPHCCRRLICVCIFCEAEALWLARLFVVYKTEVVDLADALECLGDDIFGDTCKSSVWFKRARSTRKRNVTVVTSISIAVLKTYHTECCL